MPSGILAQSRAEINHRAGNQEGANKDLDEYIPQAEIIVRAIPIDTALL